MTKRGSNNRAAPLRCTAPADGIAAWNVSGKQLTFFNANGETVARLYSSGGERFDGQTQRTADFLDALTGLDLR
jgi:hypothetical protein